MAALPKFMIADNHMSHPEDEFVYHSEKPRFLAHFTETEEGIEFEIVDDIDNMLLYYDNDEDKVEELMDTLEDWWEAFNEWVEEEESEEQ